MIAPGQWRWALGAVVANHLLITAIGLWPRSNWLGPNWTCLPAAATARNEIALTIDDGPDPGVTPQVLDILDRYAAQATFFCVGEKAARYPDLCREIIRRGHAVENHSQHHRHTFSLCSGHVGSGVNCRLLKTRSAGSPVSVPYFFAPLPACAIRFSTRCWCDSA